MHPTQRKILQVSKTQDIVSLSLRELGKLIDETHPQTVKYHLNALEKTGELSLNKIGTVSKRLEVAKHNKVSTNSLVEIPILGMASCGIATALATEDDLGTLTVSSSMVSNGNYYALKAKGNSMNQADINGVGIDSGDYVIVDKDNTSPRSGIDYVVSIINGAANIKKFYLDTPNRQIVLVSESSEKRSPIHISLDDLDGYIINGVVKRVVKNPIKD